MIFKFVFENGFGIKEGKIEKKKTKPFPPPLPGSKAQTPSPHSRPASAPPLLSSRCGPQWSNRPSRPRGPARPRARLPISLAGEQAPPLLSPPAGSHATDLPHLLLPSSRDGAELDSGSSFPAWSQPKSFNPENLGVSCYNVSYKVSSVVPHPVFPFYVVKTEP